MTTPSDVTAHVWRKNGDHPNDYVKVKDGFHNNRPRQYSSEFQKLHNWEGQVVRRFRSPNVNGQDTCLKCSNLMHDHGWIDQGSDGLTVCPGDVVISYAGRYHVNRIDTITPDNLAEPLPPEQDQMPLRDELQSILTQYMEYVLRQYDNQGIGLNTVDLADFERQLRSKDYVLRHLRASLGIDVDPMATLNDIIETTTRTRMTGTMD